MTLLDDLRTFLTSLKTSETLDPAVRDAMTVATGLQDAVRSALDAGQDVVLAGAAGSGKTHLLETLRHSPGALPPLLLWPVQPEPPDAPFVRVVLDTTALQPALRTQMFDPRPANCRAVVVA